MQCQGRFAKTEAFFEGRLHRNKPLLFLLPSRCRASAISEALCQGCLTKRESTNNSLEKRGNKYIPNQGSLLHGTILEPIPDWSRLYNGVWFQKQIDNGYTLTEETRMKVEEALKILNGDMEMPKVPVLKPLKPVKEKVVKEKVVKATKKKVEHVPVPVEPEPLALPVPEKKKMARKTIKKEPNQEPNQEPLKEEPVEPKPEPQPEPVKEPKAKKQPKKPTPFKVLNETPLDVEFVEVKVRPTEIDGRKVYVGDRDKVYDLKFNYLGRKKDEEIDSSYPDSD